MPLAKAGLQLIRIIEENIKPKKNGYIKEGQAKYDKKWHKKLNNQREALEL